MRYRSPIRFAERTYWNMRSGGLLPDRFLKGARGVIHIGANTGQERSLYASYGLKVAWIEPIPEIFRELQSNLAGFPGQTAYNCLIAAQDGRKYQFYVSSNEGSSSSIFEPSKDFAERWNGVDFSRSMEMESVSLPTFIRMQGLDPAMFDILTLDTQGSELLVLEGAEEILSHFRYVQLEATNQRIYSGCCLLPEVDSFMLNHGFKQRGRRVCIRSAKGGREWDVLYQSVHGS